MQLQSVDKLLDQYFMVNIVLRWTQNKYSKASNMRLNQQIFSCPAGKFQVSFATFLSRPGLKVWSTSSKLRSWFYHCCIVFAIDCSKTTSSTLINISNSKYDFFPCGEYMLKLVGRELISFSFHVCRLWGTLLEFFNIEY